MGKQVTVFGASGAVGRIVVSELLAQGFEVVAVVHSSHVLSVQPNQRIMIADIHNPKDVADAITGSSAVISTLGSWKTKEKDILTAAATNIVPAMQQQKISRILTLTGAEANANGDESSFIHVLARFVLSVVGGKILRDSEKHLELLASSGLDWTTLRSPVMKNSKKQAYTLSAKRPLPWARISRQAVALAIVNQLSGNHESQQAPFIR